MEKCNEMQTSLLAALSTSFAADLGFYDLRIPEVRQAQADMAREYGIYGFCYYHYWFNGHLLMERPLNEVLQSKEPDFPFYDLLGK